MKKRIAAVVGKTQITDWSRGDRGDAHHPAEPAWTEYEFHALRLLLRGMEWEDFDRFDPAGFDCMLDGKVLSDVSFTVKRIVVDYTVDAPMVRVEGDGVGTMLGERV